MRTFVSVFGAIVFIGLASHGIAAAQDNNCAVTFGTRATIEGVGKIKPGMLVFQFQKYCPRGTVRAEHDTEANPIRVIRLRSPDPIVRIDIDSGRLGTIGILDSQIVDERGFRVGSVLAQGVDRNGLIGIEEDGILFLKPENTCGISYYTDYGPPDTEHRARWSTADIQKLGPLRIKEIRIFKC